MNFLQRRKDVYDSKKTRDKVSLAILYSQCWVKSCCLSSILPGVDVADA
jgi:hypothetical protein